MEDRSGEFEDGERLGLLEVSKGGGDVGRRRHGGIVRDVLLGSCVCTTILSFKMLRDDVEDVNALHVVILRLCLSVYILSHLSADPEYHQARSRWALT
jgi:hypothetical protein